jgi:hypothetical protein
MTTYDKWAALYKSMQKTVTVDQGNIDQLSKSYSERLILISGYYGDMPADRESLLIGKFAKVFTHLSNPSKEFGGNRLFQLDLDEALRKDAAYMVKPSLPGLLAATSGQAYSSCHEHLGEGILQAVVARAG